VVKTNQPGKMLDRGLWYIEAVYRKGRFEGLNTRICIILPCNIFLAPFYRRYERMLRQLDHNFDLILWNRACIPEEANANIISFNRHVVSNNGEKKKILQFIKFAVFARKIIRQNKYDKIIILGSYSGTMAFLSHYLSRHYRKNYWLDIRDYTYEWCWPYRKAMAMSIKNSYATVISSPAYETFLPKHEYLCLHNLDVDSIEAIQSSMIKHARENKIRISFIGNVRYYEENIKLLDALKNDDRFIVQYFGDGSEKLQAYCESNKIENTEFIGRFHPAKTAELYRNTDIINNVYGNSGIELITALSNKLYFALALTMPILVSPGTYMEKIAKPLGIGFSVDMCCQSLGDELYDFYKGFLAHKEEIKIKCQERLGQYIAEDKKTITLFKEYLKS